MLRQQTIELETEISLSQSDLEKIQPGDFYTIVSKTGGTKFKIEFRVQSYTIPYELKKKK